MDDGNGCLESQKSNLLEETMGVLKTIVEKLGLLKYEHDRDSHINVEQEKFKQDAIQAILFVCPAEVYVKKEDDGSCIVNFENCVECGTCRIAAPDHVHWFYPKGGTGVNYRQG